MKLYPVTAKTGQLLLHGFVHEMDEFGQRVFGAAARAAENDRPSCPFQCQGLGATLATWAVRIGGFFPSLGCSWNGKRFYAMALSSGAILQTGAFYAIWRRFARGVPRLTTELQ
jgi:hypothetical protein